MQIILAGRFRKLSLKKTVYALHLKVAHYEENLSQLKVRRTVGLFHIWCIREYWLLMLLPQLYKLCIVSWLCIK